MGVVDVDVWKITSVPGSRLAQAMEVTNRGRSSLEICQSSLTFALLA